MRRAMRRGRRKGHDTGQQAGPGEGLGTWRTSVWRTARQRTSGRETAADSRGPPRTDRLEHTFDRALVRVCANVRGHGGACGLVAARAATVAQRERTVGVACVVGQAQVRERILGRVRAVHPSDIRRRARPCCQRVNASAT